jgi:hypothetical protein
VDIHDKSNRAYKEHGQDKYQKMQVFSFLFINYLIAESKSQEHYPHMDIAQIHGHPAVDNRSKADVRVASRKTLADFPM